MKSKSLQQKDPIVKGKRKPSIVKSPLAPKRFKSSYIHFFLSVRPQMKKEMGNDVKLADLSKAISQKWKTISKKEKEYWQKIADADKDRYNMEKAAFKGPWTCLKQKKVKDGRAPKRSSSAFLLFCSENRERVKSDNKGIRMSEVSSILGKKWREMSSTEKKPYVDMEKIARDKYLAEVAAWKQQQQKKNEYESFECDTSASFDGGIQSTAQSLTTQNHSRRTSESAIGYIERCNFYHTPKPFVNYEYMFGSACSPTSSTEFRFVTDEMRTTFPSLPELDTFKLFAEEIFDETKDPMLNI